MGTLFKGGTGAFDLIVPWQKLNDANQKRFTAHPPSSKKKNKNKNKKRAHEQTSLFRSQNGSNDTTPGPKHIKFEG